MITMKFIGEPETASHVEGQTVQQKCSPGWIPNDILQTFWAWSYWSQNLLPWYFFCMGGGNQQLQMDSLYPWLLRHSCLSSRLAGKMNTFIPALEVHQDPVQLLNTSFTKPYKASASKNWAWKYIPQQQDCFPPSRLKSLIWRTKEVACTALSTAKPRDSHLQFPYSSTDVQLLSLFPIHILEEHHLITYISSKHPFFFPSLWNLLPALKSKNPFVRT